MLFLNMHFRHFVISFALPLLSNNDLNATLDEMVAKFKEWYPDMLSTSSWVSELKATSAWHNNHSYTCKSVRAERSRYNTKAVLMSLLGLLTYKILPLILSGSTIYQIIVICLSLKSWSNAECQLCSQSFMFTQARVDTSSFKFLGDSVSLLQQPSYI